MTRVVFPYVCGQVCCAFSIKVLILKEMIKKLEIQHMKINPDPNSRFFNVSVKLH